MVWSVQGRRDLSVCVERLCTDGLGDRVLGSLSIFVNNSSTIFWRRRLWRGYGTVGRATVPISALNVNETDMGRPLVISHGDLCEGSALRWGVNVCFGCLLWRNDWSCKWHNDRGCGGYRGTGAWCVESEHLIWACGASVDDEIVGRQEAFAWWPGWMWAKGMNNNWKWILFWSHVKSHYGRYFIIITLVPLAWSLLALEVSPPPPFYAALPITLEPRR